MMIATKIYIPATLAYNNRFKSRWWIMWLNKSNKRIDFGIRTIVDPDRRSEKRREMTRDEEGEWVDSFSSNVT